MNREPELGGARAEPSTAPGESARANAERIVRSALDRMYDLGFLETHPLARAEQIEPGDVGSAGRALRRRLLGAIDALRDPRNAAGGLHRLLVLRYVDGLAPAATAKQLGISRSSYYEEQGLAVAAVAAILGRESDHAPKPAPARDGPGRPPAAPALETSFVGRDSDLVELSELLVGARLVTVAGPAGTGKTRLSAELARRWSDLDRAAVVVVQLAPLTNAGQVLPAVAQAVGVQETPGVSLAESIAARLRAEDTLLVLDNVEHVLPAAPQIADLLARAPALRVLATSREPLGVPGEQEYALQPLSHPPPCTDPSPDDALAYPAVRLFVDRARAIDARFSLGDANVAAVVEIC